MDIAVCHDLKTERREVSQGLPPALRFVPIAFYAAAVLCSLASVWFVMGTNGHKAEAERWLAQKVQLESQKTQLDAEKKKIEEQNNRADKVVKWVEGAHSIQPLSASISRSIGEQSTISEIIMTRSSERPEQIYLTLRLDNATSRVLDTTLDSIRSLSFRAYQAQSTNKDTSLDYNAILVWQKDLNEAGAKQ